MCVEAQADLDGLLASGRVVRAALDAMAAAVRAGVSTAELDAIGAAVLAAAGARSAPKLVYGFPGATCISVNDEIVHGIPGTRVLEDGDLLKLDVTAEKDGYMTDAAVTVVVGVASETSRALVAAARRAFDRAMEAARAGGRVSDIGRAVSRSIRHDGFSVIKDLSGHGIGRTIHEAPSVPNVYDPRARQRLKRGLVIAVEPMLTSGSGAIVEDRDGWTVRTADAAPAAHYEQTIVVMDGAPILLTAA
ncbi:MAG TPA: type I methionyl aminopeptidase [Candidatus Polarisedimenticolaceae bacterium]|nr:type I methionyl aminopeptidase [Candidatus Polarisedimenticolaceae bacterium]